MGGRRYKSEYAKEGQWDFHSTNKWSEGLECLVKVMRHCVDFMTQGKVTRDWHVQWDPVYEAMMYFTNAS